MPPDRRYGMYEEIQLQSAHLLGLGDAVARAAEVALPLLAGRRPLFTGCGAFLHAADLAARYLAQRGGSVEALGAYALRSRALDPQRPLVAFSHALEERAVRELLTRAAAERVPTLLVTGRPDAPAAGLAQAVAATGYAQRLSLCPTIGFTLSSLLGVLLPAACASAALPQELALPQPIALAEAVAALLAQERRVREAAQLLRGRQIFALGEGEGVALVRQFCLQLAAAAHLPCVVLAPEDLWHGFVPALAKDALLVAVLGSGAATAAQQLQRLAGIVGFRLLLLDLAALRDLVPGLTAEGFPWVAGVYLQLLAYHAALARGKDPDRLRGEEDAYRRAAEAIGEPPMDLTGR